MSDCSLSSCEACTLVKVCDRVMLDREGVLLLLARRCCLLLLLVIVVLVVVEDLRSTGIPEGVDRLLSLGVGPGRSSARPLRNRINLGLSARHNLLERMLHGES